VAKRRGLWAFCWTVRVWFESIWRGERFLARKGGIDMKLGTDMDLRGRAWVLMKLARRFIGSGGICTMTMGLEGIVVGAVNIIKGRMARCECRCRWMKKVVDLESAQT
jgi:hypothetical protein